jgi:hypothetical protein
MAEFRMKSIVPLAELHLHNRSYFQAALPVEIVKHIKSTNVCAATSKSSKMLSSSESTDFPETSAGFS